MWVHFYLHNVGSTARQINVGTFLLTMLVALQEG